MKKEKGFTLVELLIVVAIIGILAAIAIPQFNKYKVRGYVASLRSDLKNAHTAAQAYLTDFPNGTVDSTGKLSRGGWKASQNITFKVGNMQTAAGSLVLSSTNLNNTNVAPATKPSGYTWQMADPAAGSADGEVQYDGTTAVPVVQ